MTTDRRGFLGKAALGASGLVAMAGITPALAGTPTTTGDKGQPGQGGFGRDVQQLPPGATVAYHDPKDVGEMPDFVRSLDGSKPKITSGGWAKESTEHQLPIMKGLAGVHMFLDPGGSRELHWHAIAAEWAYVIEGQCQTVVLDPSGQTEINNYKPGDLWFFPKGHGHSIQTIGDTPCHFLLSFDNGAFSEHGTFSITDWVDVTPKDMLAKNFGLTEAMFDSFPKGETYIQAGPVLPASFARLVRDNLLPRDDRAAWGRLWAVLAGSGRMADRAGEVLDRLLDVTDDALQAGGLDEREQVRARKFLQLCEGAADRITVDEDDPLAWAGSSVVAFNPPARKVIAQLVDAIAAHRRAVGAGADAGDRRLWRVLRQTGLDPDA